MKNYQKFVYGGIVLFVAANSWYFLRKGKERSAIEDKV